MSMEKRSFKNAEQVSLLGFGTMRLPVNSGGATDIDMETTRRMVDHAMAQGVNYFDTAVPYHEGRSEPAIGELLATHPRESYLLATKMPPWDVESAEDIERIFAGQLEKCKVEFFDYYLMHCMTTDFYPKCERLGMYDILKQKQREGKIRRLGFSFHDNIDLLRQILDEHEWDFVQLQLNYLDWDIFGARGLYELATERGVPVIVMEPVRGGALATLNEEGCNVLKKAEPQASIASWAIRFCASLPNVLTVLSGMSNMEQVEDNIRTLSDFSPLAAADFAVLEEALKAYRAAATVPCTACAYCMDCPAGVDIPGMFKAYNAYKITKSRMEFDWAYAAIAEAARAHNCTNCGRCLALCPQQLNIPEWMGKIAAEYAPAGA